MPESTIEDLIHRRADAERARGEGMSFAPLYDFLGLVARMAQIDEREAIFDSLPKERDNGKSQDWNDGYTAALTAIIRAIVERSIAH